MAIGFLVRIGFHYKYDSLGVYIVTTLVRSANLIIRCSRSRLAPVHLVIALPLPLGHLSYHWRARRSARRACIKAMPPSPSPTHLPDFCRRRHHDFPHSGRRRWYLCLGIRRRDRQGGGFRSSCFQVRTESLTDRSRRSVAAARQCQLFHYPRLRLWPARVRLSFVLFV